MQKCLPNKLENGHCIGFEASRGMGEDWTSTGGWRKLLCFLLLVDVIKLLRG
jgi:hypothetical protein